MKRLFDLSWAVLGLAILALPLALIALLVAVTSRGPVFFRQERIGRGGRPFRIWKFRTMVVDAERLGAQITVGRDPRITRIGSWLRATKIDELPQLLNVLGGEMSFVGPRPEVPKYVALYTDDQRRVLDLRPGITDEASLKYRDESEQLARESDPHRAYVERIMPDKVRINLAYAERANIWTDTLVIIKTVLGGRGQ